MSADVPSIEPHPLDLASPVMASAQQPDMIEVLDPSSAKDDLTRTDSDHHIQNVTTASVSQAGDRMVTSKKQDNLGSQTTRHGGVWVNTW